MQQNLTVSALTKYLQYKFVKDPYLQNVRVQGEISNFKAHHTGHYYFSLKDKTAVIRCVIFNANKVVTSTYQPKNGDQVIIEGHVDIFVGQGSYQIYGKSLSLDGLGQLYEQYELLKQQFETQGYFDANNKKMLPKFPEKIALLTAKEGAAIQDMLSTLKRRYPLATINIYPTLVQGAQAQYDIVKQLKCVEKNGADVIILGRGGGSIEDLWAFNEPRVIEAMFNCSIPIISAVGHETDYTLADFVADVRAATPTAAAELVAPDISSLADYIINKKNILSNNMTYYINYKKQQQHHNHQRLRAQVSSGMTFNYSSDISRLVVELKQKLQELSIQHTHSLEKIKLQLERVQLDNKIKVYEQSITLNKDKLKSITVFKLERYQQNLMNYSQNLKALSPIEVMKRGYIMAKENDKVITSVHQVQINQLLTLYLSDGALDVEIKNKYDGEKNG